MEEYPLKGLVFAVQRYSLDDGSGIRTCVFLKGCPLRCAWCHNAESQRQNREISYCDSACIHCSACTGVCTAKCHHFDSAGRHVFERDRCVLCGDCAKVCPTNALETVGTYMTAKEILHAVMRDRVFYRGDGGLTITGGEPMAQPDFTVQLAQAAKSEGINVVIETSGVGRKADYRRLAPWVNCFFYDCKADSALHEALTGIPDHLILENMRELGKMGCSLSLRCPIVPNANLTGEYIEKIITLANEIRTVKDITLLPYHRAGAGKSVNLGKEAQRVFDVPSPDVILALRQKIAARVTVPVR